MMMMFFFINIITIIIRQRHICAKRPGQAESLRQRRHPLHGKRHANSLERSSGQRCMRAVALNALPQQRERCVEREPTAAASDKPSAASAHLTPQR